MSKRGPRFSEKEKLAIVKEGEKNGVKAVCAKYGVSGQTYRVWRYNTRGIEPKKQFSIKKRRSRFRMTFICELCARR
jgi:transposase-like protein